MPYKVSGLRSWNINAESFESAARFYRDVLGAEETARHQVAGANVVRLRLGRTGLGIFDAKDGPRPGVPHHPGRRSSSRSGTVASSTATPCSIRLAPLAIAFSRYASISTGSTGRCVISASIPAFRRRRWPRSPRKCCGGTSRSSNQTTTTGSRSASRVASIRPIRRFSGTRDRPSSWNACCFLSVSGQRSTAAEFVS